MLQDVLYLNTPRKMTSEKDLQTPFKETRSGTIGFESLAANKFLIK